MIVHKWTIINDENLWLEFLVKERKKVDKKKEFY